MKTIQNDSLSAKPIPVPDDADIESLQKHRERIAKEITELDNLNIAKTDPSFQLIVKDSYLSMQMIERAGFLLDPKKPDFAITFANLQGRWRERLSLTEELLSGKRRVLQQKGLLVRISNSLKDLQAKLKSFQNV